MSTLPLALSFSIFLSPNWIKTCWSKLHLMHGNSRYWDDRVRIQNYHIRLGKCAKPEKLNFMGKNSFTGRNLFSKDQLHKNNKRKHELKERTFLLTKNHSWWTGHKSININIKRQMYQSYWVQHVTSKITCSTLGTSA